MKIFRFDGALHFASFDYFLSKLIARTGLDPRRLAAETQRGARSRAVLVRVTPAHHRLLTPLTPLSRPRSSSPPITAATEGRGKAEGTAVELQPQLGVDNRGSLIVHEPLNGNDAKPSTSNEERKNALEGRCSNSNDTHPLKVETRDNGNEKHDTNALFSQATEIASPESSAVIYFPAESITDNAANARRPLFPRLMYSTESQQQSFNFNHPYQLPIDTPTIAYYARGHTKASPTSRNLQIGSRSPLGDDLRIHNLILDCSGWSYIDVTALEQLADVRVIYLNNLIFLY